MRDKKISENKKKFVLAMTKSLGNVSRACEIVGISRNTYYRYIEEDPDFKLKIEDIHEKSKDFAESKLLQHINEGDKTCLIFYLKTKCKDRGYVERAEQIVKHIEIDFTE